MSVRIGLGTSTQPFSEPRAYFRWAQLCDAGGIDSIWKTDRLSSQEPYLEAVSTMGVLAGPTERVKFGMNAVVVTTRDPLVLAKQCATVDYLSGGRLLPVFAVGNDKAPEWKATGRSPEGRGARADEALEIMKRLWAEPSVDFDGEHFQYRGASVSPRPVQKPLPLWIGGHSKAAIRRTARLGTGWLGGLQDPATAGLVIEAIRRETAAQGRSIASDHVGVTFPLRIGKADDAAAAGYSRALERAGVDAKSWIGVGSAEDAIARCRQYCDAGAHKFVMIPLARGDADWMHQTRLITEEVVPVVHAWD